MKKNQNIHIKKQYRKTVTDVGLAAKHHPGATTHFELLLDNLVILFVVVVVKVQSCLNRGWRQMQIAPLSKILAS